MQTARLCSPQIIDTGHTLHRAAVSGDVILNGEIYRGCFVLEQSNSTEYPRNRGNNLSEAHAETSVQLSTRQVL